MFSVSMWARLWLQSLILLLIYFAGKLEPDFNLDFDVSVEMPQTPAPRSTKPTRSRKRVTLEESSSDDEDSSPTSVVPNNLGTISARSQRASKTAALSKMTTNEALNIDEDDEEEEGSEVTSDEDGSD